MAPFPHDNKHKRNPKSTFWAFVSVAGVSLATMFRSLSEEAMAREAFSEAHIAVDGFMYGNEGLILLGRFSTCEFFPGDKHHH